MNDQDIEKYLARFKLKGPNADMRRRVLAASHQAWVQPRGVRVTFPGVGFRWVIGYACAAALLLLLSALCSTWDSLQTARLLAPVLAEKPMAPDLKELYAELGQDPEVFHKLSLMAQPTENDGSSMELWKQRQEKMKSLGLEV